MRSKPLLLLKYEYDVQSAENRLEYLKDQQRAHAAYVAKRNKKLPVDYKEESRYQIQTETARHEFDVLQARSNLEYAQQRLENFKESNKGESK